MPLSPVLSPSQIDRYKPGLLLLLWGQILKLITTQLRFPSETKTPSITILQHGGLLTRSCLPMMRAALRLSHVGQQRGSACPWSSNHLLHQSINSVISVNPPILWVLTYRPQPFAGGHMRASKVSIAAPDTCPKIRSLSVAAIPNGLIHNATVQGQG